MTPVTLVMAYYENAGMLREHYRRIREMSALVRDMLSVVIVDDGSPNSPAFAEDLRGAALQVYRVREDIRWNQDACRNIGVRHAETNWVMLTDIDHMLDQKSWEHLLSRDWNHEVVYNFLRVSAPEMLPYKPHPNSWLMAKSVYEKIGGYDERFAGYYGTDSDFRDRLVQVAQLKTIKSCLIRVPRSVIPDASTTTYLRKQPEDREGLARVKKERATIPDWTPLRYRFSYDRVFPSGGN
jgi:predicted glycosyltransferase involved in capsule biosynthesis